MINLPTGQAAAVLAKSDWFMIIMMAQAVAERVRFTLRVIVGSRSTRPYPVPPASQSHSSGGYGNVGGGDSDGGGGESEGGDAVVPLPAPRGGGEGRQRGGRRQSERQWRRRSGRQWRWSRSSSRAGSGWSDRIILYDNNN